MPTPIAPENTANAVRSTPIVFIAIMIAMNSNTMEGLQGTPGLVAGSICVALAVLGVVLRRRRIAASKTGALLDLETGWDEAHDDDLEHDAGAGWRAPLLASSSAFEHVDFTWPMAQMVGVGDDWMTAAAAAAADGGDWKPSSIIL